MKGFFLTRHVLEEKSSCTVPPISLGTSFEGSGTAEGGCWHPKAFDRAVIVLIDALRYDFTVPTHNLSHVDSENKSKAYHNALPFLYETALTQPQNAFLLPFIADPPTTTFQRLKGLTTGTLPTYIDAGSNFAGAAIEEDNLLFQLKDSKQRIVHLGDDLWESLFPGYFEDELSRPFESLNVWDLHTVDDGVTEHVMPLLAEDTKTTWDVVIAHYLGVDHAGHRYGPDHPAMAAKLRQMNNVLKEIVTALDNDTLLIVMGDHGMDEKGDHGGESDDEMETALWMYSRKGIFGSKTKGPPPLTAKIASVRQMDLVPTFALLLGLPIPFNNLGSPIEEAFIGQAGTAWEDLGNVARLAAAGIKRYQEAYYGLQGIPETTLEDLENSWQKAEQIFNSESTTDQTWQLAYQLFSDYQANTLHICERLWVRYDVVSMTQGVIIMATSVVALVLFMNSNIRETSMVLDPKRIVEAKAFSQKHKSFERSSCFIHTKVLIGAFLGFFVLPIMTISKGAPAGSTVLTWWKFLDAGPLVDLLLLQAAAGSFLGIAYAFQKTEVVSNDRFATTSSARIATVLILVQAIGLASVEYTLREESILLWILSGFGLSMAILSARQSETDKKVSGIYYSAIFVAISWVSSLAKLCREEQLPICQSTYHTSSSSSAPASALQVLIPLLSAVLLPSVVRSHLLPSLSYTGFTKIWIGWTFRTLLMLIAIFWTLDTADDDDWFPEFSKGALKTMRLAISRTVLGTALLGVGLSLRWPPLIFTSISKGTKAMSLISQANDCKFAREAISGNSRNQSIRYSLFVGSVLLVVVQLQKPIGVGTICLMSWQILCLVEVIYLHNLTDSPIGPCMLSILGMFYFFKTGHQATLSSIQWESAFIPFSSIHYPWSPILVILNTFGAQVLAALSVPLLHLWSGCAPEKNKTLERTGRAIASFLICYTVVGLGSMIWAAYFRKHLMLYRLFSPRFITGVTLLLTMDVMGIIIVLLS